MKNKIFFVLLFLTLSQAQAQEENQKKEDIKKTPKKSEVVEGQTCFEVFEEDEFGSDDFLDEMAFDVKDVEHKKPEEVAVFSLEAARIGASALWYLFITSPYNRFSDFLKSWTKGDPKN